MYIDSECVVFDPSSAHTSASIRTWNVRKEELPSEEFLLRLRKSVLRSIPCAPLKWIEIVANDLEEHYAFVIFYAAGGKWIKLKAIPKPRLESEIARIQGVRTPQKSEKKADKSDDGTQKSKADDRSLLKKKTRGDIKIFTIQAKRRFKESLHKIDRAKAPSNRWLHVTLTMPVAIENAYKILEKTFAFMKKKMKLEIVAIWRKEWQDRGAEHFHFAIYIPGSGDLDEHFKSEFEDTLVKNWSSRIQFQCGLPVNSNACNVRPLDDEDALEAISVYGEKDDQDVTATEIQQGAEPLPGRRWGILNKKGYNALCTINAVVVPPSVYWIFRRDRRSEINEILRSHPGKKKRFRPSRYKVDEQYLYKNSDSVPVLLNLAEQKAQTKWCVAGKDQVPLKPCVQFPAPNASLAPPCNNLISINHITPPPHLPAPPILPHVCEISSVGTASDATLVSGESP